MAKPASTSSALCASRIPHELEVHLTHLSVRFLEADQGGIVRVHLELVVVAVVLAVVHPRPARRRQEKSLGTRVAEEHKGEGRASQDQAFRAQHSLQIRPEGPVLMSAEVCEGGV